MYVKKHVQNSLKTGYMRPDAAGADVLRLADAAGDAVRRPVGALLPPPLRGRAGRLRGLRGRRQLVHVHVWRRALLWARLPAPVALGRLRAGCPAGHPAQCAHRVVRRAVGRVRRKAPVLRGAQGDGGVHGLSVEQKSILYSLHVILCTAVLSTTIRYIMCSPVV